MSASIRQPYGHSTPILTRAQSRRERLERGETIDQIASRDGTSRGAVFRDLRLAREESTPEAQPSAPRRRMGERAMLFRAWTVTRNLDVFRLLGLGASMLWLSVIMQIHLNSDGDLYFGPRCRSLDELARGAGGTEADLQELIDRDLLLWLEEGGVALPEDLGLRLPERVGGRTVGGTGATPPQRRAARGPDGKQGEILMTMPSSPANSESAKPESGAPHPLSHAAQNSPENPSRTPSPAEASPLAGGEGTTTTTKDSDSSLGGGGGESVTARDPATESANVESANVESANVESLGRELLALIGRSGPPRPVELELVGSWLQTKSGNEVREAIGTRMEQKNAPKAPDLTYFDQRVRGWAPRLAITPAPEPPRAPEPPEDPAQTVAWLHPHEPDNPRLFAAWAGIRATLRERLGDHAYRSWLREMVLLGLDGDLIAIGLPSGFKRDHVRANYGSLISTLWVPVYPEAHRVVDFRVIDAP